MPEVFLDKFYCHLDHHTLMTWSPVNEVVNERARQPMIVMFGAFILFKKRRKCHAKKLEDIIKIWPVKGKKAKPDYHSNFTAAIFEESVKSTPEHMLLSFWKKSIDVAKQYSKEHDENFQQSIRAPELPERKIVPVETGKKRKLDQGKAKKLKSKGTTTDH
ncbi:hypothetical protein BD560DRAFT_440059 [Blakeslea trispora]|nr:hypothetical protein BD560DRAFT_440059 [Blakeslea trispora]